METQKLTTEAEYQYSCAVQPQEVAVDWQEPMVQERKCCSYNTHQRPNQPHQAFTP